MSDSTTSPPSTSSPPTSNLLIKIEDSILYICINRISSLNSINNITSYELYTIVKWFDTNENLKVAILYGRENFSSGADLKAVSNGIVNPLETVKNNSIGPMGPTRLLISKPIIAAISGYAVAGGLELAIWCDLRVMEKSAITGVLCRNYGVPLIDGGTFRLPDLIGFSRAMDWVLTGRKITAQEAYDSGFANRLCEDGKSLEVAKELALQLCRFPQLCMRTDRLSMYTNRGKSTHQALENEFENSKECMKYIKDGASNFIKNNAAKKKNASIVNDYECVLFDLGGVIFDSPLIELTKLSERVSGKKNALNAALNNSTAWKEFESGKITENDFYSKFSIEHHIFASLAISKEIIAIVRNITIRPMMLQFVQLLRDSGYKLGVITNNFIVETPSELELSMMSQITSLFDVVIESSKVKLRKPNPEIWKLACNELKVGPEKAIFFDDLRVNCEGSEKAGVKSILVSRFKYQESIVQGLDLLPSAKFYFEYNLKKYKLIAELIEKSKIKSNL